MSLLPEPPDGTAVVTARNGRHGIWVRDDKVAQVGASQRGLDPEVRWFTMDYGYAQSWDRVIANADVFYLTPALIGGKVVQVEDKRG